MAASILTSIGLAKIAAAAGSSSAVKITHVALGDGENEANYVPTVDQTALKNERARAVVANHLFLGDNTWRVKASFPPETVAFGVREIGFFDEDGDLIGLWASDGDVRQTGVWAYNINHYLNFSQVGDGLVIVESTDDHQALYMIEQVTFNANTARHILETWENIVLRTGAYPQTLGATT